jgi:glycine cleavage system H protein
MKLPNELRYTASHEWVRVEEDGIVTVGITDHAQEVLGDLVFIQLPEVGDHVEATQECAVVESVKAAADVYAPVSGEVLEVNTEVADQPELLNQDAYAGWLFKIKLSQAAELDALLSADAYHDAVDAA